MAKINKNQKLLDWMFPSVNDGANALINAGALILFKERTDRNGKTNRSTKKKTS